MIQAGSLWLQIVPWGMGRVLNQFKVLYNNPLIYITENGKLSKSLHHTLSFVEFRYLIIYV